jgi:two-component flavin-dependent monooxygenase
MSVYESEAVVTVGSIDLTSLVRERATKTHQDGRLGGDVLAAFHDPHTAHRLGLDAAAPVRYSELFEAVTDLGVACGSTAWVVSVMASSAKLSTLLPESARNALHGDDEVALICAGLIPAGTASCDASGWTLSGRWPYVTAAEYADWALLAANVKTSDGRPLVHFFAVPRDSYRIESTWDMTALRATRTDTVIVDDVLLGHDFTFDRAQWLMGDTRADLAFPAKQAQVTGGVSFLMPAMGMARGALEEVTDYYRSKNPGGGVRLALVKAAAGLFSAELLIRESIKRLDSSARLPREVVLELERNAVFAAELLRGVQQGLRQVLGTHGFSVSGRANRHLGDLELALSHVALRFETSTQNRYSALMLGE